MGNPTSPAAHPCAHKPTAALLAVLVLRRSTLPSPQNRCNPHLPPHHPSRHPLSRHGRLGTSTSPRRHCSTRLPPPASTQHLSGHLVTTPTTASTASSRPPPRRRHHLDSANSAPPQHNAIPTHHRLLDCTATDLGDVNRHPDHTSTGTRRPPHTHNEDDAAMARVSKHTRRRRQATGTGNDDRRRRAITTGDDG
ncbi:hypothetical protein EDB84DRAFT_1584306 [Lactarius hengduanensis]|nr:hypothetical protein EDB84DRAFT_1584306 [Lactarius hengduanensis]